MKDQFGRAIDYMRVSVTDRCNLRCVYCMPPEGVPFVTHQEILSFDEITRVCRIGAELGITKLKLTGGEPLVRKGLPDLLRMLKTIPGIEQVTLTTNGTLLKEQINKLVSNGLDSVNISIDTLDPERYCEVTRGGNVEKALEGLDAAAKFPELGVKVNCVPLKSAEDEEYIRLAFLAKEGKADVRFIEMMPIGMGKVFAGRSKEDICSILKKVYGEPEGYGGRLGNGPAVYVQFPGFRKRVGFISAVSHQFCSSCNRVRLTSEGYLKPCLQYGSGTDLRALLRNGADDHRIREEMERTIYSKPARHQFGASCAEASGTEDRGGSRNGDGNKGSEDTETGDFLEKKEMSRIGG